MLLAVMCKYTTVHTRTVREATGTLSGESLVILTVQIHSIHPKALSNRAFLPPYVRQ